MSSSYPWIKDSNTLSGTPPADRVAVNSPNGLYFSTSTNSSILAPTNSNLTIETAGTGDVIVKTNSNNRLTIDDSGTVTAAKNVAITDGSLTINNTTGGGTSDPLLVLNQNITGATLYEEVNNSRTASSSTLYQVSYKGKNSTNSSTIEYANMSVIPVSIGTTAASSKIDFKVSNTASYVLELESNNSVLTSNLYMSNNNVNGIAALNYYTGNFVAPDYVINLDGSSPISPFPLGFGSNNSTRILCKNIGLASPITNLPSSQQPPLGGSVYCSETFNSSLWIGTSNHIYWSQDNGATWNTLNDSFGNAYYFNGAITCMKAYPVSSTFLIIGGLFTEATSSSGTIPLNFIGIIEPGNTLSSMSWYQYSTSIGFNSYVNTIEYYNGYLYIGGNFTADNSGGSYVQCNYFSIIEYNPFSPGWYLYSINNVGGSGTNNYVNSIIYDTTTSNGYLIVGGAFSNIADNTFNTPCYGAFFIGMNGSSVTANPIAIDFTGGDVKSMIIIGSSIYVVGSFTNSNSYNYFATLTWNTGTGNYDVGPNPYSSSYTPTGDINFIGANYTNSTIYWGENFSPYKLYSNGNFIANSPSANRWLSVIYLTGTAANGICFCPSGASYSFYYQQSGVLTLDSQSYIIVNNGQEYGPNAIITFPTKGTSILLEWNPNAQRLQVVSNNGCTGIGLSSGSGGISTISAGSGISVSSPTGPTTTISNSGVLSLSAGSNISLSGTTGNITISASGGGGGDVYWSQLNDAYSTYANLASGSSYNNPYSFGLNNTANLSITMELNTYETNYLNVLSTQLSPYLRVGQQTTGANSGYYTLLAGVNDIPNNDYTTLATINSNMHLYANKSGNTLAQATGKIYLYGIEILPGNDIFNPLVPGFPTTFLGTSTYYWREVNSALFNQVSDIKLKENISTLDTQYSVDFIKRINPVSYTFKNDEKQKTHFGVIAQEVKEILGDKKYGLHNDSGENQTVAYTEFIAPLIKSVQFLLQKVESLEQQIKELKK